MDQFVERAAQQTKGRVLSVGSPVRGAVDVLLG